MNKLDQFEESLKNAVEGFEVPYNSSDWSNLVERMDEKKGGVGSGAGLYMAFLAGALLIGGTAYYAFNSSVDKNLSEVAVVETLDGAETSTLSNDELTVDEATDDTQEGQPVLEDGYPSTADDTPENRYAEPKSLTGAESENIDSDDVTSQVRSKERQSAKSTSSGQTERLEAISTHNGAVNDNPDSDINDGSTGAEDGFSTTVDESCSGSTISFKLDKVKDGVIYLWNFGDGSFSNKPEPEHVYERAGRYAVTLSMTSQSGGPIENKIATEKIEIYDAPTASFVHASRDELGKIPYVHFENNSRSAVNWEWDFGDGTKSSESHPDHIYRKAGTYAVTLTVSNAKGCTDVLSMPVTIVKDNNLKAPKTFSPNGDGVKDTFLPESLKELKTAFRLSVYETTGGLLFSSEDARKPWNGRSQNGHGEMLPAGDYVWVVDFLDGDYKGESFQGKVSLLH